MPRIAKSRLPCSGVYTSAAKLQNWETAVMLKTPTQRKNGTPMTTLARARIAKSTRFEAKNR